MSVVSIAEAWPSPGKPFTVAELDRMPDDAHRYELLDGVLVVSPWPTQAHQMVAFTLASILDRASPPEWQVVPEPAVMVFHDTEFAPDIVVVARDQRDGRYEEAARVSGDEAFAAHRPFGVEVVPARLVAGLQPPSA